MQFRETDLPGVIIIEPHVFEDPRGFFMETYHASKFVAAGIALPFVQDNHSRSSRGVLRGLHYQVRHVQGKLVRAIHGEIYDVALDVRPGSATLGQWFGTSLSEDNKRQVYVPPGFAHGFCVTSEVAEIVYKCTDLYDPARNGPLPGTTRSWPLTGRSASRWCRTRTLAVWPFAMRSCRKMGPRRARNRRRKLPKWYSRQ